MTKKKLTHEQLNELEEVLRENIDTGYPGTGLDRDYFEDWLNGVHAFAGETTGTDLRAQPDVFEEGYRIWTEVFTDGAPSTDKADSDRYFSALELERHGAKQKVISLREELNKLEAQALVDGHVELDYSRVWADPRSSVGRPVEALDLYYRRPHWRLIHQGTDEERMVRVKGHYVRPDLPIAERWDVVTLER